MCSAIYTSQASRLAGLKRMVATVGFDTFMHAVLTFCALLARYCHSTDDLKRRTLYVYARTAQSRLYHWVDELKRRDAEAGQSFEEELRILPNLVPDSSLM